MRDLRKSYPNGKVQRIHLSFYPGAKIGVIGGNGAGKSTLLRVMAGLDDAFQGEAWLAKGYTVGYLPQEPVLDESLDVLGNVKLGVASTQALLDEFESLSMKLGEPMDDDEMMKVLDRQAAVQDKIDAVNAWKPTANSKWQWMPQAAAGDSEVTHLGGGEKSAWHSAACCWKGQTSCS